jgi:hypothetical protein
MSKVTGSRAVRAMGSEKKEKGKSSKKSKIHRMEIRHAASGGYIVTHHQKPAADSMLGGAQEPEEHAVPDVAALQQHVAANMGDGAPAPAAPPAEAAPAQGMPGQ